MMKSKLYIGCHTEARNWGEPRFKAEVVLDVDEYKDATRILRVLEQVAKGLLNKDDELIKQMYEEGIIKI